MNNQTPERKLIQKTLHNEYFVTKIFDTIQGEGPLTGHPAIFIRLSGCNLQCPQCDTEYTTRDRMTIEGIIKIVRQSKLRSLPGKKPLIVITGGEPFRQPIWPLVDRLLNHYNTVQIETNGTYIQPGQWKMNHLLIVCSPKTPKINPDIAPAIGAYKYVIDRHSIDQDDGLPTAVLGYNYRPARPWNVNTPIYISPADVKDPTENALNMKAAADICMKYGYILSLQTHKIVGLE